MRERLTIAVGKDNPTGIVACKGMDTINDLIRHGEVGPFAADNLLDSGKARETPASLVIYSGPKGNCTRGTLSYNSVVTIFVRLHIFTKFELTVLVETDCLPCDNTTWAKDTGQTIL